jgi:hypothetical protein
MAGMENPTANLEPYDTGDGSRNIPDWNNRRLPLLEPAVFNALGIVKKKPVAQNG